MVFPEALVAVGGRPLPVSSMAPDSPQARALGTFRRIASEEEFQQLIVMGAVFIEGKYADYVISATGSTVLLHGTKVLATGCLIIENPSNDLLGCYYTTAFPPLDHMIANYLVLKSQERFYWKTAILSLRDVGAQETMERIRAGRDDGPPKPEQAWPVWPRFMHGLYFLR